MYTSCIEKLARSIGQNCESPLIGGNTGRGVIIAWDGISGVTQDAENPRKVLAITLAQDAVVCALDNAGIVNPLDGSNTTGSNDTGFALFVKTVAARILSRGADVSRDIVEPIVKSAQGFLVIVEKQDKVGDGSFEVIGLKSPAKCVDPSTVVRNENENGGSTSFQLQSTEPWFEVTFAPTPEDGQTAWQAAKVAFDRLFEQGAPY